jgi:hypothetical protein
MRAICRSKSSLRGIPAIEVLFQGTCQGYEVGAQVSDQIAAAGELMVPGVRLDGGRECHHFLETEAGGASS